MKQLRSLCDKVLRKPDAMLTARERRERRIHDAAGVIQSWIEACRARRECTRARQVEDNARFTTISRHFNSPLTVI